MESEAGHDQNHAQVETKDSIKSLHTTDNRESTSSPSPPSSAKAAGSDKGHKENVPYSTKAGGGEPSASGSASSTRRRANAGIANTAALVELQADC